MSNFGGKSIRARRSQWQIHALLVILFLALCFISTSHAQELSDDLIPLEGAPGTAPGGIARDPQFGRGGQQHLGAGQNPGLNRGFDLGGFGARQQESFLPGNVIGLGNFLLNFDQAAYNQTGKPTLDRIWRLSQEFVAATGAQIKVVADKLKAEIVGLSKREAGKITVTDLPLALCMDPTKVTVEHRAALRSSFEGTGVTVPDLIQRPGAKSDVPSTEESGGSGDKDLAPIAGADGKEVKKTSLGSPPRGKTEEEARGLGSPIRRPGRPKIADQFEPTEWAMGCSNPSQFPGGLNPGGAGLANNGQRNAGDGNPGSGGDGAGVPGGGPKPTPPMGFPGMGGGGGGGPPAGLSPPPPGGPMPPFGQPVFAPPPAEGRVPSQTVNFTPDRSNAEATLSGIEQDQKFFALTNLKRTAENGERLFTLMSYAFPYTPASPVNGAVLRAGMASINAMAVGIANSLKKGKDSSSSSSAE